MLNKPVNAAFELVVTNLTALMNSHPILNSQAAVGRAAKVDQETIGRILNRTNEPGLEVLARIAKAFHLELWQLLVPKLQPTNPPMLAAESEAMKALFANLGATREAIAGVLRTEGNTQPGDL